MQAGLIFTRYYQRATMPGGAQRQSPLDVHFALLFKSLSRMSDPEVGKGRWFECLD